MKKIYELDMSNEDDVYTSHLYDKALDNHCALVEIYNEIRSKVKYPDGKLDEATLNELYELVTNIMNQYDVIF